MTFDINAHRKAIVSAMINGLRITNDRRPGITNKIAFGDDVEADGDLTYCGGTVDWCSATGLFFPGKLAEMQITVSNYGPLFMGLWLDCEVRLDEESHGNTLFPRWLAEVLNEECQLGIEEEDIYENDWKAEVPTGACGAVLKDDSWHNYPDSHCLLVAGHDDYCYDPKTRTTWSKR